MPYGYVLLVATVILAVRHVRSTYASGRSKGLVGSLAAFAILAPYLWPGFLVVLASPVLQLALGFYVVFHQAVWSPDKSSKSRAAGP
jgi:hypothetical protein